MLAYCGIDCSACAAYMATQANDVKKLTHLVGEWFKGSQNYTIVMCDGCKSESRIMQWCKECPTRLCARARTLESCALCRNYGCEKLLKVFEASQEAQTNLECLRRAC
jgi:hypothetical protein